MPPDSKNSTLTDRIDRPRVLVVIPARGGSKGIPRKNLRSLAGSPLITYSIRTALASVHHPLVVVSTDDEEIAVVSRMAGAKVHMRPSRLAVDATTLDPVIHEAVRGLEAELGHSFDLVITQQPTSPLLKASSLDAAISRMLADPTIDTTISAVNDTHLSWKVVDGRFVPNYEERVNRQYLPPTYRETGGFLISRRHAVTEASRIGLRVQLHELKPPESIDIDSHADWGICTHYLRRKKLLFVVTGHREVGLGHVYNSLLIANDLADHDIAFLVDADSRLAFDAIAARNYPVALQSSPSLVEDIVRHDPDIVVNDRLDTDVKYMQALRARGYRLINIEDLGSGARLADVVINALYQDDDLVQATHVYSGAEYACIRDEFILSPRREPRQGVERVLLTFGGTDPSRLTIKTLDAIEDYCARNDIAIDVVTGLGYRDPAELAGRPHAVLHTKVNAISVLMREADLAFTSAGRTLFELASLGTPAVVLAQNDREMTHPFASESNGFLHLGLGKEATHEMILAGLTRLVEDDAFRLELRKRMLAVDLTEGRRKVARIVQEVADKP